MCAASSRSASIAPLAQPVLFFAMELLQGHTLADRIRAGRLPRDEAFPIAVQLAEGLQAAHRAGIVHADFKSANVILVTSPGGTRAVITDFGVARLDPGSAAWTRPVRTSIRFAWRARSRTCRRSNSPAIA